MAKKKFTSKHILLLLLYSPGRREKFNEPIEGRTRIIKSMFLFDKEVKKDFLQDTDIELVRFAEFFPWNYGPFSRDIYSDIEFFMNNGFIEDTMSDSEKSEAELNEEANWREDYVLDSDKNVDSESRSEESFQLTPKGYDYTKENIYSSLSDNQKLLIKEFKAKLNSASLRSILRYVYLKYPKYTSMSRKRGSFAS